MRCAPLLISLAALGLAAPSVAAAPEPLTLACAGPFASDATEATLKAAFGDENVVYQTVPGPEGSESQASVIFPGDPARTATVHWWDEAARARPASISVSADYAADPDGGDIWKTAIQWRTAQGIAIGDDIAAVEAANGKPFVLSGFGWDYGGYAVNWNGGKLDAAGGCAMSVRFTPSADTPDGALGETELSSSDPAVRASKPRISSISIGYPAE